MPFRRNLQCGELYRASIRSQNGGHGPLWGLHIHLSRTSDSMAQRFHALLARSKTISGANKRSWLKEFQIHSDFVQIAVCPKLPKDKRLDECRRTVPDRPLPAYPRLTPSSVYDGVRYCTVGTKLSVCVVGAYERTVGGALLGAQNIRSQRRRSLISNAAHISHCDLGA